MKNNNITTGLTIHTLILKNSLSCIYRGYFQDYKNRKENREKKTATFFALIIANYSTYLQSFMLKRL